MKQTNLLSIAALVFISSSTNAALLGRLETSPGSGVYQAFYDDQLDITWVADANINGLIDWDIQMAWVASLTIDGVGGWRLPNMDINGDNAIVECSTSTQTACMDNEYGHLYHYGAGTTLGGGVTSSNPGPFSNIQIYRYWSSTEWVSQPSTTAWIFGMHDGLIFTTSKFNNVAAWAVHDGDVGTIPIPAAVYLFGSGLLGLIGIARRNKPA